MSAEITLQTITDRIVAVTDKRLASNAGAVALNNFVVMIDPTMRPANARQVRQLVEAHFKLPVKFLFVTHYHGDHVMGMGPFHDTCIVGSRQLAQNIMERQKTDWSPEALQHYRQQNPEETAWMQEVEILLPTLNFEGLAEIRDEERVVELHHVGGHTSCSAYAYVPDEKVLCAGDLMFAKTFPYAGDASCDPERWMEIFTTWLVLDFETLIPGHGPVVGRDEVITHLQFFKALREATKTAIQAGGTAIDIIVPEFYTPPDEDAWLKSATLEHWFTFYQQQKA